MYVHGQPLPRRLEGEQAFRPRTEQQGVVVSVLALGKADGQSIDSPELRLDAVEPSAHRDLHPGWSSRNVGDCAQCRSLIAAFESADGQSEWSGGGQDPVPLPARRAMPAA